MIYHRIALKKCVTVLKGCFFFNLIRVLYRQALRIYLYDFNTLMKAKYKITQYTSI